jgi:hypothetical protein
VGITGKYNFRGIQRAARVAIEAAIAATTWGTSWWFKLLAPAEDIVIDDLVNLLANEGLIIINIGASIVNGEIEQSAFDKAMSDGLASVSYGGNLTETQKKAIDEKVIQAFRNFGRVTSADQLSEHA